MTNLKATDRTIRTLESSEIDLVSGGNPVLFGRIALAVGGYIGGKLIDGIVEDSGILDSIEFKGGKVIIGGKTYG